MIKRLLAIVAIAAALAACSPNSSGSGDPTVEPTLDAVPSLDAASPSVESASPAP